MDSHRKGDLTEAIVIAELKRRSIPVSTPFGDNERYDLVLETPQGELLRIQVKTGWVADGTVEFHARSQHTNSQGNTYKTYDGEIDYFLVYCHDLDTLYLIGEHEFGASISLRVDDPKPENRRINWASEFEFDARWPPEAEADARLASRREATARVIELFTEAEVTVAHPRGSADYHLIVEEPTGALCRVFVKSGWRYEGRIRYAGGAIPETVRYLAIYVAKSDRLYVVPRSRFESSIVLQVDEPEKQDSRINWADDYAFPENSPW